jgi:hypothetical protein
LSSPPVFNALRLVSMKNALKLNRIRPVAAPRHKLPFPPEDDMPDRTWDFWDSPDTLVETTRQVLVDGKAVTVVVRDLDSRRWQFLSEPTFDLADVLPTTLREIVRRDPSLRDIAALPRGWHARRHGGSGQWRQQRNLPAAAAPDWPAAPDDTPC